MPEDVHMLVASSSSGRYALDDPTYGPDVTSGQLISIEVGGHWIDGRVEHAFGMYTNRGLDYLGDKIEGGPVIEGYYFIAAEDGRLCGLCVGMRVRLR